MDETPCQLPGNQKLFDRYLITKSPRIRYELSITCSKLCSPCPDLDCKDRVEQPSDRPVELAAEGSDTTSANDFTASKATVADLNNWSDDRIVQYIIYLETTESLSRRTGRPITTPLALLRYFGVQGPKRRENILAELQKSRKAMLEIKEL